MAATVDERVIQIVCDKLDFDPESVKGESSFVNDLGADSLDTVELVMAFEEEFGIEIPDDKAEEITTVQQAIDHIKAHTEDSA